MGKWTSFMWVPINSGNRSGSCSENCGFRIDQVVGCHSENEISYSENGISNSESCSENTPELSESSENGPFTPRVFFLKLGWSPGFWHKYSIYHAFQHGYKPTINFRVGFWQNGFFADFYFWAAGFFRGFPRRIFSPHFCGKKCPEKSSRKIPAKILQNLYNKNPPTHFCRMTGAINFRVGFWQNRFFCGFLFLADFNCSELITVTDAVTDTDQTVFEFDM